MGRASLREGLRILEIQGLITIKPGPGRRTGGVGRQLQRVRADGDAALPGRRATFREVVDARMMIEPLMAKLAAEARNPKLIVALHAASDRTSSGLADDQRYSDSAADFHVLIMKATGNRILSLFAESLRDVYNDRVSGALFPIEDRQSVQRAHEQVIEAIEAGDAEAAERLMRGHMEQFTGYVSKRYPGLLDEVVDWR